MNAWIAHRPWQYGLADWQLWFELNDRAGCDKCPLRLTLESRLRNWLLREFKLPLATLSYTELRLIAEGKGSEARRLHASGIDTLSHGVGPLPLLKVSML